MQVEAGNLYLQGPSPFSFEATASLSNLPKGHPSICPCPVFPKWVPSNIPVTGSQAVNWFSIEKRDQMSKVFGK